MWLGTDQLLLSLQAALMHLFFLPYIIHRNCIYLQAMEGLRHLCQTGEESGEEELKVGLLCLVIRDAFESNAREMAVEALEVCHNAKK